VGSLIRMRSVILKIRQIGASTVGS
jgi:hypothetical protein